MAAFQTSCTGRFAPILSSRTAILDDKLFEYDFSIVRRIWEEFLEGRICKKTRGEVGRDDGNRLWDIVDDEVFEFLKLLLIVEVETIEISFMFFTVDIKVDFEAQEEHLGDKKAFAIERDYQHSSKRRSKNKK